MRRPLLWLVSAVLATVMGGCALEAPTGTSSDGGSTTVDESKPHAHTAGSGHVSLLVGDGTRASEVGYSLEDVSLPDRAGLPGSVAFTVTTFDGTPLRDYVPEQTKDLHLYVVRADLAVFRHLHPTLRRDGTWVAPLTLPEPGRYRVIAEFVARDEGGNGDHVMLGRTLRMPGAWSPQDIDPASVGHDGTVRVDVGGDPGLGAAGRLGLEIRDGQERPVRLDTYLGTFAHVTGFHVASGSVVHMHPLGQPVVDEDGTRLSFHTDFEKPGEYLCFVQARVDGFLHTVPVRVKVS